MLAVAGLYLIGALFGSLFPVNQSWQQDPEGVELFVETNGLHTGLIVPIRSDYADWSDLVRPEHLDDSRYYGSHILIGWGHAGVYRNAPRWQDLRPGDALSAVIGSDDTLIHVSFLTYPQAYPHYRRRIRVSGQDYARIAKFIRSSFRLDAKGRAMPSPGYGQDDLFYEATGHYSALNTCNNWTADALAAGGVRVGRWPPFQGGVMRWFVG